MVPVNVTQFAPGQAANPVSDDVGEDPVSPTMVLAPVLVIPEPASTANCPAVPNGTTVAAAWALPADTTSSPADTTAARAASDTPPYRTPRVPGR